MKASIIESACRSVNHWNSKSHIDVTCINNFRLSHQQITWEENNAEIIFIAPLLHLFFLTFSFLFIMFSLCKDFSTLAFQSENPSTRKSIAFSLAVPVEDAMTREPRRRAMIVESDRGRSPTGTNSAVRDCSVFVVFFSRCEKPLTATHLCLRLHRFPVGTDSIFSVVGSNFSRHNI